MGQQAVDAVRDPTDEYALGHYCYSGRPLGSTRRATIGGALAASTSGPMRYSYGLARDWLIGIGVVNAQGVETRAGGQVVKNVTGPPKTSTLML